MVHQVCNRSCSWLHHLEESSPIWVMGYAAGPGHSSLTLRIDLPEDLKEGGHVHEHIHTCVHFAFFAAGVCVPKQFRIHTKHLYMIGPWVL